MSSLAHLFDNFGISSAAIYLISQILLMSGRVQGIHEINKGRKLYGEYHHLYPELRQDANRFKKYDQQLIYSDVIHVFYPKLHDKLLLWQLIIQIEQLLVTALPFLVSPL
jgi:hypothetical protein